MASKKNNADREIDLHGYTSAEARVKLNTLWSTREWQGLQRVRVIHGTGSVLHALVKLWCEEKGIQWTVESHNPGTTILHPGRRLQAISAPPHRPLHPLKQHRPAAKKREAEKSPPHPDDGLSDDELMAREFTRLGEVEARSVLRNKRSDDPGPFVKRPSSPTPHEPVPLVQVAPQPRGDAMAEEFERLAEEDALTLFKRKRDLLPPKPAPKSAASEKTTPHLPALPQRERDLMAEEFARLGDESPGVTRGRKRT